MMFAWFGRKAWEQAKVILPWQLSYSLSQIFLAVAFEKKKEEGKMFESNNKICYIL